MGLTSTPAEPEKALKNTEATANDAKGIDKESTDNLSLVKRKPGDGADDLWKHPHQLPRTQNEAVWLRDQDNFLHH